MVHFDKDETKKFCKINIIDDSLFEENEKFSVSLSQPIGGHLGKLNTTAIVIESDSGDGKSYFCCAILNISLNLQKNDVSFLLDKFFLFLQ